MKKLHIIIIALCIPLTNQAQVVIGSSVDMAVSGNPEITIQSPGSIINNSTFDFSATTLRLELTGATQSLTGNFVLNGLLLNAAGVKTVNGNLTIANRLAFSQGVLTTSQTGKILYTGPSEGIILPEGNNTSYVDGIFYNSGSNPKKFPIGSSGVYAPAVIEKADGEVGMIVNNGSAQLLFDNVELIDINTDRYWEIKTDITQIDSRIGLSLNGISDTFLNSDGGVTVVQAPALGVLAENLESSTATEELIVSNKKVSAPIVAIGKETKIVLKIHDLITPFGSPGENDKLFIENIHRFNHNTVTLLDRWGVQVAKWSNYTNDSAYDFGKLSPGNYICIVQYGNIDSPDKVEQQMVTVLKTN